MEVVCDKAQRNEHEGQVHPRAKKEKPEGFDPARLIFGHAKEADETLLVRESVYMTVRTMTVLEEGCPICWRHLR